MQIAGRCAASRSRRSGRRPGARCRRGEAPPAVVDKLQALMTQMEARQRQLDEHLLAGQEQFHRETGTAFNALAQSVEASCAAASPRAPARRRADCPGQ